MVLPFYVHFFRLSDSFRISHIQNGFSIGIFISLLINVVLMVIFIFRSTIFWVFLSVLLSTVYFVLISIAFMVMCFLMRRKVRRHKWLDVHAKVMHKINACTFLASFFMLFRVLFDVMEILFPTWNQNYFAYPIYFLMLDIFPEVLMIIVLRTNVKTGKPTVKTPLL
eukprot:Phypoly_transcript_22567.p1 GENE.Phypoly_transcript_22567~~Phypoly_transcript_22567.p1  ORF type:complete len:167 (+),score=1.62 Phypoly_transcript_22567:81-581(+)